VRSTPRPFAEDTVTTFNIQLTGQRVVFEPYAIVWAEEPHDLGALWRQRMRWSRGNIQVSRRFAKVWFRPWRSRLGSPSFGVFWFTVTLMPAFMVATSSLVVLYLANRPLSADAFHAFWTINLVAYLFITLSSLSLDPQTARLVWREALLFPGSRQPRDHRPRGRPSAV